MDGLKTVRLCVGYKSEGKLLDLLPSGSEEVALCEPVWEEMPGWNESTFGIKRYEDLPVNARAYLKRIEEICGAEIAMISTGPDREETIVLRHPFQR